MFQTGYDERNGIETTLVRNFRSGPSPMRQSILLIEYVDRHGHSFAYVHLVGPTENGQIRRSTRTNRLRSSLPPIIRRNEHQQFGVRLFESHRVYGYW